MGSDSITGYFKRTNRRMGTQYANIWAEHIHYPVLENPRIGCAGSISTPAHGHWAEHKRGTGTFARNFKRTNRRIQEVFLKRKIIPTDKHIKA